MSFTVAIKCLIKIVTLQQNITDFRLDYIQMLEEKSFEVMIRQ